MPGTASTEQQTEATWNSQDLRMWAVMLVSPCGMEIIMAALILPSPRPHSRQACAQSVANIDLFQSSDLSTPTAQN